jgi:hypothetical protein
VKPFPEGWQFYYRRVVVCEWKMSAIVKKEIGLRIGLF